MVKLNYQSIVQYEIDTETNQVKVLKKFVTPMKGAKQFNKAKPKKVWKKEDRWKCRKCGSALPPGALECPNCGYGVME